MSFNTLLIYAGAATIAILFLYSTRNFWISLIAGFISFCVFYFSYATDDLKWDIIFLLTLLKQSAIIYFISFVPSYVFYKIFPFKQKQENKKGSVNTPPVNTHT